MDCARCKRTLQDADRRAGISIFVMGDEYTYTYWFCEACQEYTVEAYHDRFLGEDSVGVLAPQPKAVGDRAVALIQACPSPHDKWCECPSHQAMYYGLPREGGDGTGGAPGG